MRLRATAIVVTAVSVLTVGAAAPALAQADGTDAATDAPLEHRIDVVCARVDAVQARVDELLDRIRGDAGTVGSNAWLEDAAAEADDAGLDHLAELIRSRIEIRTERIDVLEARLDRLADLQSVCEELQR